ncbi:MAG: LysM peptidoglycan-binding domain-containing protein [Mycobacteriales bacterium]
MAVTWVAVVAGVAHRPPTPGQWQRLAAANPQAALLVVIRCGALGCLLWLWVAVGAGILGALPGSPGRVGQTVARRLIPAVLRPLLGAGVGTALVLTGAVGGGAASAAAGPGWITPAPWTPPMPPLPVVAPWPTASAGASPPAVSLDRPIGPTRPPPEPGPACAPSTVTVAPGDTLWGLTAAALGEARPPSVARHWPQLWLANRAVVGGDPDLIRPGERLVLPVALWHPTPPSQLLPGEPPCPSP